MASPGPDADDNPLSSSPQDSSAADDLVSKLREEIHARIAAAENVPPRRAKIKPTPGPWPKNHGGPIRILSNDGVLTENGKKVEQKRLAKLAATNENEAKVCGVSFVITSGTSIVYQTSMLTQASYDTYKGNEAERL